MDATAYWVEGPWPGRVAILPRPWGGDWLEDYVGAWKALALDMVVSTLTREETAELVLCKEEEYCAANGIGYILYPIIDRAVPDSFQEATTVVRNMVAMLSAGGNVGVHCRMGVGRSSLLVACCLVDWGLNAEEALERVAKARGCSVPDTDEQREWVDRFGRHVLWNR